jgi:hypothetical protein
MNKDSYTDLIIQQGDSLLIFTQSEQGLFSETKDFPRISLDGTADVFCSVGDFNGDASLDIMVTKVCTLRSNENVYSSSFF